MSELVFDCVMHFNSDLNPVVSSVSKKYYEIDSQTRKDLTVHVHYLPNPSRLSLRFPNIESLSLKSYSFGDKSFSYRGRFSPKKCSIPVTPWIQEIAKLERLKSLSIRNMVVSPSDLRLLAKTQGANLRSLEIQGCKLFSDYGLADIARCCINLRSLRLKNNWIVNYDSIDGKWFHDLALHNTGVMESITLTYPNDKFDVEDVTLLAKKCSNSLVSLNIFPPLFLDNFKEVFEHTTKLNHFSFVAIDEDEDYSDFRFPPNIRSLGIEDWSNASFSFLLPYLHQLRKLEVLHTVDMCGDKGLKFIGQFCKKLRKLTYNTAVTHLGLKAVAQGCPDLEYLDVSLLIISNEALECVGNHLKNLRDFRIWGGRENGIRDSPLDSGVRAMLMGCSKLERLDFRVCFGGLTDVGLAYVGKYGHNLRSLSLTCTVGLSGLAKGCPKLRKLKLDGCPFSKQAIATHVFNINQSLRYIRFKSGSRDDLILTRPMVSAEGDKIQRRRKKGEKINLGNRPKWR